MIIKFKITFELSQAVSKNDIAGVIKKAGAWKAPGHDLFPNGFLKVCGPPLFKVLAEIAMASFQMGYFPVHFRRANVAVLRKLEKST